MPLLVAGWLAVVGAPARGQDAGAVYVAPYGLTKADLGDATAPNFLRAVLGEGSQAEQEAAIAVLASDRKKTGVELESVTSHFKKSHAGVQAVVWRDTSSGKYKRASDKTRFDPDHDRIEVVFTKFDLKSLQTLPGNMPNATTDKSNEWVVNFVKAEMKLPTYQAAQALAGGLGGSGDFKSGNIFPVAHKAQEKVADMQEGMIGIVRSVETMPTICMLLVFEYPDQKTRIPSKIQYYYSMGKTHWGGRTLENK
jgi:hypothetical protein